MKRWEAWIWLSERVGGGGSSGAGRNFDLGVALGLRTYALRRVRDAFRENRTVGDPKLVEELLNKARDSLAIIQRQVPVQKNIIQRQVPV
ncbi:hypothetical protein PO909_016658 [Leuciscus waleckii]